jgi:hypothetical protein
MPYTKTDAINNLIAYFHECIDMRGVEGSPVGLRLISADINNINAILGPVMDDPYPLKETQTYCKLVTAIVTFHVDDIEACSDEHADEQAQDEVEAELDLLDRNESDVTIVGIQYVPTPGYDNHLGDTFDLED